MKIQPAILLAGMILLTAGCFGRPNPSSEPSAPSPEHSAAPASTAASATPAPASARPTAAPSMAAASPSAPGGKLDAVISSMTLEEKIGQMILAGVAGTELDAEAKGLIAGHRVGGIILYANNIKDLKGLVALTNALKAANQGAPAPLFISVDQEGGKVSRLPAEYAAIPANRTVGQTGSAELAGTMGKLIGRELASAGFNMDYAPVLDVNSNPNNPIIGDRSFGPTAALVSKLGMAEMKGLHSVGLISVVKHYPGHGDTSVDSHLELPVVNKTKAQLQSLEWVPFQTAVQEQADAVMVAHILFPKLDPDKPASLSEAIIGKELRGRLGYKGVVMTDDLGMGAIKKHYDLASAAISTVKAGSDILLVAHGYQDADLVFRTLLQAVKDGNLTEARINESVYRILSLKTRYKLTDQAVPLPDLTALNRDIIAWKKHL